MSEPMFGTGTEDMWNRLPQVYREEDAKQPAYGAEVAYAKNRMLDPQQKTSGSSGSLTNYSLTRITTGLPSGFSYGLQVSRIGTVNTGIGSIILGGSTNADPLRTLVTPGETISTSAYVWTDQPNARARLYVEFRNTSNITVGSITGAYSNIAQNTWEQRSTLPGVVPAGAAYAYLVAITTTLSGNTVLGALTRATGGMIATGSTLPAYFDGDTEDTLGHTYSWTGTAHASTSELAAFSMKPNYPYKKYLSGPGSVLDTVLDMLAAFYVVPKSDGGTGTDISDLVDSTTHWADPYGPVYVQEWLKWIAMMRGIRLDTSLPLDQQRAALALGTSYNAGTKRSIGDAVQATLTGSRYVAIYDHASTWATKGSDPWYNLLIITKGSEQTTDPVQAVIDAGAKPAGVILHSHTFESSWQDIETAFPHWSDWEGKTWQQIEEAGI